MYGTTEGISCMGLRPKTAAEHKLNGTYRADRAHTYADAKPTSPQPAPASVAPLGRASHLSVEERKVWKELSKPRPWLTAADRANLEQAVVLTIRDRQARQPKSKIKFTSRERDALSQYLSRIDRGVAPSAPAAMVTRTTPATVHVTSPVIEPDGGPINTNDPNDWHAADPGKRHRVGVEADCSCRYCRFMRGEIDIENPYGIVM